MTENANMETLTAKTPEPDASPASTQKSQRWVKPLIWALSIILALCVGTAVGGGVVYGVMRTRDRFVASPRLPSVQRFRFGPGDVTVDVHTSGALVVEVTKGSPAEQAGLQKGDVIVSVKGQKLDQEHGLAELVAGLKPGDKVDLEVWGPGGQRQDLRQVSVTLGEHPERKDEAYLGVTFVPFPGVGSRMGRQGPFGESD